MNVIESSQKVGKPSYFLTSAVGLIFAVIVLLSVLQKAELYCLSHLGQLVWSSAELPDIEFAPSVSPFSQLSPSIGDLDGDLDREVVVGYSSGDNSSGGLIAFDHQGIELWRSDNEYHAHRNSPALADMDLNGALEICYGYTQVRQISYTVKYNCRNSDGSQFQYPSSPPDPFSVTQPSPWPKIRHDERNTSNVVNTNRPPILSPIGTRSVQVGSSLSFHVSATDPDKGNHVTLSASPLPLGATFVQNGGGTALFSWTPRFSQVGTYTVTFTASDGVLSDSELVSIAVTRNTRKVIAVL